MVYNKLKIKIKEKVSYDCFRFMFLYSKITIYRVSWY